jgi:hypothetical protein
MEYDQDKVDEMVLALLQLTMFEEDEYGARAWKGHVSFSFIEYSRGR